MAKKNNMIFSWDVESNGLLGDAFAIGAIVYKKGEEVKTFLARCPINGAVDEWVENNVLPQMTDIKITHDSYESMLADFCKFFIDNKEGADVIFHMGVPVEAKVILDMHKNGLLGPFEGAYPWLDIAGVLKHAGEECTSVDNYNSKHGIIVPQSDGGTHNPLYDSRAAALCYMDLMKKKINK